MVAGGLVTSRDAGLSVPDWPLSYGKLMPPMEGGILYEHGHRMIATTVGLLTIVSHDLAAARGTAQLDAMAWRLSALVAVIAQGVLGGLTVLLPAALVDLTRRTPAWRSCFFRPPSRWPCSLRDWWLSGPAVIEEDPRYPDPRTVARGARSACWPARSGRGRPA